MPRRMGFLAAAGVLLSTAAALMIAVVLLWIFMLVPLMAFAALFVVLGLTLHRPSVPSKPAARLGAKEEDH